MGITIQVLLDQQGQALHALAHVRVPRGDPHSNPGRNRDHRRARTLTTRANAAASTSDPTITRSPPASTISIRPAGARGAGENPGAGFRPITAGMKVSAPAVAVDAPNWRRQVNSMLALRS